MNSLIKSPIANYYKGKSIFLTGGTGFVGKVLIEKLLRSCTDLNKIYVLVRPKRGKNITERISELSDFKIFDNVKYLVPNLNEKLVPISGDIAAPNLGISNEEREMLQKNVNIVIHSAATVKFTEPLAVAVDLNVKAVQSMLDFAKKMKNLDAFTYVSTAYANCHHSDIDEKVHDPLIKPSDLIKLCEILNEEQRNLIEENIIDGRPNTYNYTKSIAESLIKGYERELPLSIVRPSTICATWKEPFPGWIDNVTAVSGILASMNYGMSCMLADGTKKADFIPVDTVANMIIAATWFRGSKQTQDMIVYNNASGLMSPLTYSEFVRYCNSYFGKQSIMKSLIPFQITTSPAVYHFNNISKQLIPALFMDLLAILQDKKPRYFNLSRKMIKNVKGLEFFAAREFKFSIDNVAMLQSKLSEYDSSTFNFDVTDIDWENYVDQYINGLKKYLLKEHVQREVKKYEPSSSYTI